MDDSAAGTMRLVGAGPAAPELLILKAARLLAQADIVFYRSLVSAEVLTPPGGRVGRRRQAYRAAFLPAGQRRVARCHCRRRSAGGAPHGRRPVDLPSLARGDRRAATRRLHGTHLPGHYRRQRRRRAAACR